MTIEFRYREEESEITGKTLRPVAALQFKSRSGEWIEIRMYIDSGADITLIPLSFGRLLGFKNMEKNLEEKHPHKVVAVHKGKVISIGDAYDEVVRKLHELGIKVKKSLIHRLGPSEDAIAIMSANGLTKKLEIVGIDMHPKLDIDCLIGRNLFGEMDVHFICHYNNHNIGGE